MTLIELNTQRAALRSVLRQLDAIQPKCSTCTHWEANAGCGRFEAMPPAETQKVGCEEWVWDAVPF